MKKIILVICALIFSFCTSKQNKSKYEPKQYEPILRNAINKFEIVFKNSPKKNPLIEEKVWYIMSKAANSEIVFTIDTNANYDLSGMGFNDYHDENRKPIIVIGSYFLDNFDKNPTIFYSALIHEFTHAYDYFNSTNYYVFYKNNKIVRALFEADAYAMESLFIENYLLSQNFNITKFESFLLNDFKNNNLNKMVLVNSITSLPLLHNFLQIRDSKDDIPKKTKQLTEIGENLLTTFHKIRDIAEKEFKMEVISHYVTFTSLIDQLVYDIEQKESQQILDPKSFSLKKYPKLFQVKQSIIENLKIYDMEFQDYIVKENHITRTEI